MMEDIHIEGVHEAYFTPTVNFEASTGRCEISGESYLEETSKFYARLIDWLKRYIVEILECALHQSIRFDSHRCQFGWTNLTS